jgi:signal transduction histidine kinase
VIARFTAFLGAKLGRRLAAGMTITLLAGLAISTALSIRDERQVMQDILEVKGRTTLNIAERRLARSFSPDNLQAFRDELEPVLEDRDFAYAFLFNDQGVLDAMQDERNVAGPQAPLPPLEDLTGRYIVRVVGDYMEILAPIVVNGQRTAGIGLGVSLDLLARQVGRLRLRLLLFTTVLIGSALCFIYYWTRKTVWPLIELTRSAERLTAGDLSARVPVDTVDEMGRLASAFNNLAESLQRTLQEKDRVLTETRRLYRNLKVARVRLDRAERLSAVGMLAAGVSHELNNPLGIILSTAGNLREAVGTQTELVEDVKIIEAETERCKRIIQGLLNFAASGDSHPAEVDINGLLKETFGLVVRDDRARGVTAEWTLDAHLPPLWVDPRQMQQVFLNLLLNAADAMGGHGLVTMRTAESIEGGRRRLLIEFADCGCGISSKDLEHIFDPFYTTKKGGAGFGLGLAVSYGIIHAHGGEITVTSELGHGSTFTITLPLQSEPARLETATRTN